MVPDLTANNILQFLFFYKCRRVYLVLVLEFPWLFFKFFVVLFFHIFASYILPWGVPMDGLIFLFTFYRSRMQRSRYDKIYHQACWTNLLQWCVKSSYFYSYTMHYFTCSFFKNTLIPLNNNSSFLELEDVKKKDQKCQLLWKFKSKFRNSCQQETICMFIKFWIIRNI